MSGDYHVLTLELDRVDSAAAAERIRESWGMEPVEISRMGHDRVWLETYWSSENEAETAGRELATRLPVKGRAIRKVKAQDWQAFWKHHFHAHPIGKRLMICPVWERDVVDLRGRAPVYVNPGLSFGTGDHFTTRFCLEMIDELTCLAPVDAAPRLIDPALSHFIRCDKAVSSFLDAGCGSGILAIAAARLGVPRVLGFDYDAACVDQSRENAALNGLDKRIDWKVHDIKWGWEGEAYDLVCANILSSLLIDQAADLWRATARRLVLSGIREAELDGVSDAYLALGAREIVRDGDGEWAALVFERPGHTQSPQDDQG